MKVTLLPFVAALGFAVQASAAPIRIYILAPDGSAVARPGATGALDADHPVAHMRWGLAAAGVAPQSGSQPWAKAYEDVVRTDENNTSRRARKHGCPGSLKMKVLRFKNWLREKVGLEPIAHSFARLHFPHGRPTAHRPEGVQGDARIILTPTFHGSSHANEGKVDVPIRHFRHHAHHHRCSSSFTGRLQRALMTLGPWEGRFVAFVIGCGIGSLLRMIYVLCVVAHRCLSTSKEDEEVEVIFTEVEEVPPSYVPDQKAPVENEKA